MLLNKRGTYFDADKGGAGSTAPETPETPETPQEAGETGGFTQAQVDRLMGDTRKEARERAISGFVKTLGFETEDAAVSGLGDLRENALQRDDLNTRLNLTTTELNDLKAQNATATTQLVTANETIEAATGAMLKDLEVPAYIKALLDKLSQPEQLIWLAEHRGDINARPPVPSTGAADKGTGTEAPPRTRTSRIRKRYGIQS